MTRTFTDWLSSYLQMEPCNVWKISELESSVLGGMDDPRLYLDVLVKCYGFGYSPNGEFLFRPGFKGYHSKADYPKKPIKIEEVREALKKLLHFSHKMGYKEFMNLYSHSQQPVIADHLEQLKAEGMIEIRGNSRKSIRTGIKF